MEISVSIPGGGSKEKIKVSDVLFKREFNEGLVHQVVVAQLSGQRQGTKQQKSRSDVAGSTKKPWKQKGTGRARAGTLKSPIWRSGGRAFAARPQDHSVKVNKKMYKAAMQSILSELVRQNRLIVVNDFTVEKPKTKDLVNKLNDFGLNSVLIVGNNISEELYLASRNIPKVMVREAKAVDPVKLLKFDSVLMTVDAVRIFEEALA